MIDKETNNHRMNLSGFFEVSALFLIHQHWASLETLGNRRALFTSRFKDAVKGTEFRYTVPRLGGSIKKKVFF